MNIVETSIFFNITWSEYTNPINIEFDIENITENTVESIFSAWKFVKPLFSTSLVPYL